MFATPGQQLIAKFKIEGRMEELEAMSKRKAEAEGTNFLIHSLFMMSPHLLAKYCFFSVFEIFSPFCICFVSYASF